MALPIIGAIIGGVVEIGKLWIKKKTVQAEGKIAIEQAKTEGQVKRLQTLTEGNIEYDQTVAEGMKFSWKDEYWTIVLSIPAILCFVPGMDVIVFKGFSALEAAPEWYQWALLGGIVASFGLRTWTGFKK